MRIRKVLQEYEAELKPKQFTGSAGDSSLPGSTRQQKGALRLGAFLQRLGQLLQINFLFLRLV